MTIFLVRLRSNELQYIHKYPSKTVSSRLLLLNWYFKTTTRVGDDVEYPLVLCAHVCILRRTGVLHYHLPTIIGLSLATLFSI